MGIDYGTKKTGIAVTDTLQIICTGLNTVPTSDLFSFIKTYVEQEEVEKIVVGMPLHEDGNPAQIAYLVVGFIRKIRKLYPAIEVVEWDERGTNTGTKVSRGFARALERFGEMGDPSDVSFQGLIIVLIIEESG